MKNLITTTMIAAAAALTLTACGSSTATSTATPAGLQPDQWEVILTTASDEYGMTETEAATLADNARAFVWDENNGELCAAWDDMGNDAYGDLLIDTAFDTFPSTGEATISAATIYALTLDHC